VWVSFKSQDNNRIQSTHVLRVLPFFVICLQDIKELLVGIGIIVEAVFYLVQILYGVVKFAGRLLLDGILAVEVVEK